MTTKAVMFRMRLTSDELAAWAAAAKAEGLTVSAWVRLRCVGAPVKSVVAVDRKKATRVAPEPVVAPSAPEQVEVCRRCGHNRTSHWIKGCLAGCPCSEQRYRE